MQRYVYQTITMVLSYFLSTLPVFLVLLSTRFVSKLPSGHKTKQENFQFSCFLRRGRDSNPRYLSVRRFSRPVQSTTLPPLQKCIFRCRNVVSLFNECKGIAYFGNVQGFCEKYFLFSFLSILCGLCIYVAMLYACLFF